MILNKNFREEFIEKHNGDQLLFKNWLKQFNEIDFEEFNDFLYHRNLIAIDRVIPIPVSFLESVADKIDYKMLSFFISKKQYSDEFLINHKDKLDWSLVITKYKLSDEVIEKCSDKIIWFILPDYQDLSEEIISKYFNFIPVNKIKSEKYSEKLQQIIKNKKDGKSS